ncbi:MAG: translocation/assembly module TamB domain-containing protein [Pseudomonadota bacterium]
MSDSPPPVPQRRRRWTWRAGVGGAALIVGASLVILGPAGPSLAAHLAEGASVWRLGRLHVEGVGGSGLGDLRVKSATLSDAQGIWARAEDLRLQWKPLSLLLGQVALKDLSAAHLHILRRPNLSPARGGGGVRFDTDLPAIGIADLDLADGVAGASARFSFAGAARTKDGALKALHLDLHRLDKPLDIVAIDYRTEGKLTLDAAIDGAPGGVLANLARAPNAAIHVAARAKDGAGALDAALDRAPLASGALNWDERGWRGDGVLHLAKLPAAADLAARFGGVLRFAGSGDALAAAGAPFQATINSDVLEAAARGKLNNDAHAVGAVALAVQGKNLPALARELDFSAGSARFDGAVEFEAARVRISGRLGVSHAKRDGFDINGEGPVEVFVAGKDVRFTGELGDGEIGAPDFMRRVTAGARLNVEGAYDRTNGAFRLSSFTVRSPHGALAGAGLIDDHVASFSGTWDVGELGLVLDGAHGAARGQWTLNDKADAPVVVKAQGAARQFSGYAPFGALLGPTPKIDASLRFTGGGTLVEYARVEGPRLRLGARGRLVGDNANLAIEASARGPANIAGVSFAGAADATGALTGKLADPIIMMEANLATLNLGGATLQNVVATLDLAPAQGGRRGRVGLEGMLFGRPASGSANLALTQDKLAFENLETHWAQVVGKGRAQIAGGMFSTYVDISGMLDGLAPEVSGAVTGTIEYANARTGDNLQLNLALRGARLGAVAADEAKASLTGPLAAMKAQLDAKGWAGEQAITLSANGDAAVSEGGWVAQLGARGQFAGAAIETRAPLVLRAKGEVFEAQGAASLGGGSVEASWRGNRDDVSIDARFDKAPLEILTAMMEQPAAGALSGEVRLYGAKKSLGGNADLTFTDARLARRSRDAVNAHLTANLGGGMLRGAIDARSGRGLVASVQGQAPMTAEAAPFRLTPVRGSMLQANWKVSGPVEGLWALFGPLDQTLGGQVDGEGAVRFANGGVTGDGRMVISAGAFDDKFSGVKLREIDAVMTFDEKGVSLDRFSATDGKAGRITGAGRLDGQDDGKLNLKLSNVVLADRPDAHAAGDGDLALEWRKGGATLSGEIRLNQADMRMLDAGTAPAPLIDVIEINRPGPPPRAAAKPDSVISPRLDLRIVAPGRVYTRTRGLEAEWSLDLKLAGDLAKPLLYGEARLVRGDFNLAGRRFDLARGVIKFSGDADDAEIDVAASAAGPALTANVALTGRALDPQIALTSDPALPEDEILPELLFGRSSRDLNGFEAAQLAASLATLAGKSAFDLAAVARAAVNLDRLEVRDDGGGVLVAGGKYWTRDVYVEVSGGALGRAGTAVEWQVRPRLFVISSFLTNGDQRVAVRWRQEY